MDRGIDASSTLALTGRSHLFFTFHSGSDDRACLDFVVQLAVRNPGITATILRVIRTDSPTNDDASLDTSANKEGSSHDLDVPNLLSSLTVQGSSAVDTVYPAQNQLTSDTADDLALAHRFEPSTTRAAAVQAGLTRIKYSTVSTSQPLHTSLAKAQSVARNLAVPLVVVAGRGRVNATSHRHELATYLKSHLEVAQSGIAASSEVRRSLGDLGTAYLVAGVGHSLLVLQRSGGGGVVGSKPV